jgi:hypothetical protein
MELVMDLFNGLGLILISVFVGLVLFVCGINFIGR